MGGGPHFNSIRGADTQPTQPSSVAIPPASSLVVEVRSSYLFQVVGQKRTEEESRPGKRAQASCTTRATLRRGSEQGAGAVGGHSKQGTWWV